MDHAITRERERLDLDQRRLPDRQEADVAVRDIGLLIEGDRMVPSIGVLIVPVRRLALSIPAF